MTKRKPRGGSLAIDTATLPERNARLSIRMLELERQVGRFVASATSSGDIEAAIRPMRSCGFRPHYSAGMMRAEGAQATCDAIEAFIDCLAGKAAKTD